MAMLEMGTNTKLSAKPVITIGISSVHGLISRSTKEKYSVQMPNTVNPALVRYRLSSLLLMTPITGRPSMDPIPRGPTTMPAVSAV